MFDRYKKITYTFLFLLYVITPLYIIVYSSSLVDYAIAAFILTLGFILHFIIENEHNSRIREFLLRWFQNSSLFLIIKLHYYSLLKYLHKKISKFSYSFYLEEGLFPLPLPDGFPVVLGPFVGLPDDFAIVFFPFKFDKRIIYNKKKEKLL